MVGFNYGGFAPFSEATLAGAWFELAIRNID